FLRDLHHEKTYAYLFDENPNGYPPICLPSQVRVGKGRVFFGAEAVRGTEGVRLRSLKMCLRCQNVCRLCLHCPNELGSGRKSGWFLLPGESDELVPADEVCAWFLAYVISTVRSRAERLFAGYDIRFSYQMAAPLGMLESYASRLPF